jgi:hypothetical protein
MTATLDRPAAAVAPQSSIRVRVEGGRTTVTVGAYLHDDGQGAAAFDAARAEWVRRYCDQARQEFLAGEQYAELKAYRGFLVQRRHDLDHAEEYVKTRQGIYEASLNSAVASPQDHDDLHRAKERRDLAADALKRTTVIVGGKEKDAADALKRAVDAAAALLAAEAHQQWEQAHAAALAALAAAAPDLAVSQNLSAPSNFSTLTEQYYQLPG